MHGGGAAATFQAFLSPIVMTLHQGSRIRLPGDSRPYQLLSVDERRGRCFVRQLPLTRHGSRVIEVDLNCVNQDQF
jgi:hypothetical protein